MLSASHVISIHAPSLTWSMGIHHFPWLVATPRTWASGGTLSGHRSLRFQHNDLNKQVISINQLEYATIVVNYLAATWCLRLADSPDTCPVVRIESNTTTSKAWSHKGCKDSLGGRTLSHIHNALLLGNRAGLQVACISTTDNVIADRISRIPHTADIPTAFPSLLQDHRALHGC